jgi:hypothetical protein
VKSFFSKHNTKDNNKRLKRSPFSNFAHKESTQQWLAKAAHMEVYFSENNNNNNKDDLLKC